MKIVVSNRLGTPIYEQLKDQIKEAIFSGELQEDCLLPSIRSLARDLKISVITTTRAYSDLEAEGFIATVQGKGSYVLPRSREMARENALRKIEAALGEAIEAAVLGSVERAEVEEMLGVLWDERPR